MQTLPTRRGQHPEVTDGVLLEQARAGHQEAFEVVVHRYTPLLFTLILRLLGDDEQASDIVQHVFVQLYLARPNTSHLSQKGGKSRQESSDLAYCQKKERLQQGAFDVQITGNGRR